jgi:hypothetical protein
MSPRMLILVLFVGSWPILAGLAFWLHQQGQLYGMYAVLSMIVLDIVMLPVVLRVAGSGGVGGGES